MTPPGGPRSPAASRPAVAGGSRAADTAARKRRLVDAAVQLASEGGYEAVQMRDVASRAGVALGTLYRHYSSKDQLLLAALADQAGILRDRLAQRPAPGDTAADRVAAVLTRASRALARDQRLTAAMVIALSSPEPEAAAAKLDVDGILRAIIASAVDGERLPDLDGVLRVLGYVWLSVLRSWVGGMIDADAMSTDLELAARLLLEGR